MHLLFPSPTPLLSSPLAGSQNSRASIRHNIMLLLSSLLSHLPFLTLLQRKLFFCEPTFPLLAQFLSLLSTLPWGTGLFISGSTFTFFLDSLNCHTRVLALLTFLCLSGHWLGRSQLDPLDHTFIYHLLSFIIHLLSLVVEMFISTLGSWLRMSFFIYLK